MVFSRFSYHCVTVSFIVIHSIRSIVFCVVLLPPTPPQHTHCIIQPFTRRSLMTHSAALFKCVSANLKEGVCVFNLCQDLLYYCPASFVCGLVLEFSSPVGCNTKLELELGKRKKETEPVGHVWGIINVRHTEFPTSWLLNDCYTHYTVLKYAVAAALTFTSTLLRS